MIPLHVALPGEDRVEPLAATEAQDSDGLKHIFAPPSGANVHQNSASFAAEKKTDADSEKPPPTGIWA